jgi:hypothetical protein
LSGFAPKLLSAHDPTEIRNLRVSDDSCPPSASGGQPAEAARRRIHQTIPPAITATARIPNAIQPQGVSLLVDSAFFDATAAPAAAAAPGLSPLVVWTVVVVVVVPGVGAVVIAGAVVTTVAVCTRVVVTVAVVVAITVVVGTRDVVAVVGVDGTLSGSVVAVVASVLVVRFVSEEIAVDTAP